MNHLDEWLAEERLVGDIEVRGLQVGNRLPQAGVGLLPHLALEHFPFAG